MRKSVHDMHTMEWLIYVQSITKDWIIHGRPYSMCRGPLVSLFLRITKKEKEKVHGVEFDRNR